jgi:hypothetical protein
MPMTTDADDDDDLSEVDREALQRAIDLVLAEVAGGRDHEFWVQLVQENWQEAAERASYHAQCVSLALKPWEMPPASGGVELAGRLVRAGLSIYEPNPAEALAKVRRKKRKARPPSK